MKIFCWKIEALVLNSSDDTTSNSLAKMSATVRLNARLVARVIQKGDAAMTSLFLALASKQSGYLSFSMRMQLVHQSEG